VNLHSFSFDINCGSLKHTSRSCRTGTFTAEMTGVFVGSAVKTGSVCPAFADAIALMLPADLRQQHSQHGSFDWHPGSFEQNEGLQQTRPLRETARTIMSK
jgi:hypothetical protein